MFTNMEILGPSMHRNEVLQMRSETDDGRETGLGLSAMAMERFSDGDS